MVLICISECQLEQFGFLNSICIVSTGFFLNLAHKAHWRGQRKKFYIICSWEKKPQVSENLTLWDFFSAYRKTGFFFPGIEIQLTGLFKTITTKNKTKKTNKNKKPQSNQSTRNKQQKPQTKQSKTKNPTPTITKTNQNQQNKT